jgi:protocatechuate 3,4-dioxygenase beta subunit
MAGPQSTPGRRALLRLALAVPVLGALPLLGRRVAALDATPSCDDNDVAPTPRSTEGPYFTPNSPERRSLIEPGMAGIPVVLEGLVLSTACRPLAGALFDIWHCDADGNYDNEGYRLRGHQFTDAQGRYRLETIVPGLYPGRTRHYHVKVQAPGGRVLTTQLYFPDEVANGRDGIFRPELQLNVADAGTAKAARFDFVVAPLTWKNACSMACGDGKTH